MFVYELMPYLECQNKIIYYENNFCCPGKDFNHTKITFWAHFIVAIVPCHVWHHIICLIVTFQTKSQSRCNYLKVGSQSERNICQVALHRNFQIIFLSFQKRGKNDKGVSTRRSQRTIKSERAEAWNLPFDEILLQHASLVAKLSTWWQEKEIKLLDNSSK